jgi:hypothetical protein
MKGLRLSLRHLCLLLLLQLAVGPLMLVGVVVLSKLAVTRTIEHGLVNGIIKAVQSDEWQSTCEQLASAIADGSNSSSPGKTPKPKEGKTKFTPIAWEYASALPEAVIKKQPPWFEMESWASAQPQAPPGPPPRVA